MICAKLKLKLKVLSKIKFARRRCPCENGDSWRTKRSKCSKCVNLQPKSSASTSPLSTFKILAT